MKHLTRICFCLLFVCIVSFLPKTAFASSVQTPAIKAEKVSFEIKSGVSVGKTSEATFDKTRTITGTAERNSVIKITVSQLSTDGVLVTRSSYVIHVGSSGIFSQTIELDLGTNYVDITAEKKDRESVNVDYRIKRKSEEIKNKLQDTIVLPKAANS